MQPEINDKSAAQCCATTLVAKFQADGNQRDRILDATDDLFLACVGVWSDMCEHMVMAAMTLVQELFVR